MSVSQSINQSNKTLCDRGKSRQGGKTHATTAGSTATATTTATTATAGSTSAAFSAADGLAAAGCVLRLLGSSLGPASELDGDLAAEHLLARELGNGSLGLGGSGEIDKGVSDRTRSARISRDRRRFTAREERVSRALTCSNSSASSFPLGLHEHLHEIALEEFVEIPLSGRIGEIPNVETTALFDYGDNSVILGVVGARGRSRSIGNVGGSDGVGDLIDRHGETEPRLEAEAIWVGVVLSEGE